MPRKVDALKDRQEANMMNEHREQKFKLGAILSLMTVQIQQQNEGVKSLLKTMNDLMPIVSMSLDICQQLSAKTAGPFERTARQTLLRSRRRQASRRSKEDSSQTSTLNS